MTNASTGVTPRFDLSTPSRSARVRDQLDSLAALANDLAGEFALEPLLERILRNAVELLGCESGSICTIDEAAHSYRKEVDLDVGCRSGEVFPLDEGVTGAVVRAGRTVIFRHYSSVPHGHIRPEDGRYTRAVIGVPIRAKSALIGACVVFGSDVARVFDDADAELLELFATHASVAIANSRLHGAAADRAKSIAVAAERERSMRDVYDAVGQSVASVLIHLADAHKLAGDGNAVIPSLELARQAAVEAMTETERAVRGLGPSLLDRFSLEDAISEELVWAGTTGGARTQLLVMGERTPVAPDVAQQLFRIVQEALANAVSHSGAAAIRLGLVYGSGGVSVIVEDDGRGFDAARVMEAVGDSREGRGLGLGGLASRANQVGGTVQVDSTPGWGTKVRADMPYSVYDSDGALAARWRVLVVHDQPVIRAGLVRLLNQAEPGVQVVGEIGDSARAVDVLTLLRPDVVLADIQSSGIGGAALVEALAAVDSGIAVVFLVGSRDDDRVHEAARAGARGFVDRGADAVSLGRAVMSAVKGDVLLSGDLLKSVGGWRPMGSDLRLTTREREVRGLVERGWQDKHIAVELGISVKTVEKHVGTILRKTGASNRTVLAALASSREGNPPPLVGKSLIGHAAGLA